MFSNPAFAGLIFLYIKKLTEGDDPYSHSNSLSLSLSLSERKRERNFPGGASQEIMRRKHPFPPGATIYNKNKPPPDKM